jgi:DNA-directed RNA polymerase subunit RPC12/RpoP
MPVDITCPNCGKIGSLANDATGRVVRCPGCGTRFVVGESAHAAIGDSRSSLADRSPPANTDSHVRPRMPGPSKDNAPAASKRSRIHFGYMIISSVLGFIASIIVWYCYIAPRDQDVHSATFEDLRHGPFNLAELERKRNERALDLARQGLAVWFVSFAVTTSASYLVLSRAVSIRQTSLKNREKGQDKERGHEPGLAKGS